MSAVSASTPCRSAPAMNRPRYASSASCERLRLIARRSPSASPTLKPASAIATSRTWSWKTTTPSVERRQSASSGWSTGGTNAGSSRRRCRCSMYGCTALPWIGPGLDELRAACEAGRIEGLKGFGKKTQDKILAGIDVAAKAHERIYWAHADEIVQQLLAHMREIKGIRQMEV